MTHAKARESAAACEAECRLRGADGKYRWFLFQFTALRDEGEAISVLLGTASDIDKQKSAQAQQAFLARASDLLGSTLDVGATLERIARLAIDSLGTWCQIDLPDANGELRTALALHQDPGKAALLADLIGRRIYNADAPFGPPATMRSGKPQVLQNVSEAAVEHVIPDPRVRALYRRVGYAAGMMVPLRLKERVIGVLGIASDDHTRLYGDFEVAIALDLGQRGGAALENARSFAREQHVASTLQRALLPAALPQSSGVRFWFAYAAMMQGELVGGDWYDAFSLDEDRIAVSMGDVAGHGVDAAVTMSLVRQSIRAAALEGHAPGTVLARANRMLLLESPERMTTALFGVYDLRARALHYSIAGHPAPIRLESDGAISHLEAGGPPLGLAFDDRLIHEACVDIGAGAALVCFTDGLIEYDRNIARGYANLTSAVRARAFLQSPNPASALIEQVLDTPQQDDIAVLVMQVAP